METVEYIHYYDIEHDGDVERYRSFLKEDGYKILSEDYDHKARTVEFKITKADKSERELRIGDTVKVVKDCDIVHRGTSGIVKCFYTQPDFGESLIGVEFDFGLVPFKRKNLVFVKDAYGEYGDF